MTFDDTDKATATLIETAIKDANVSGITGYTDPAMTEDQYNAAGGIGQSINRDTAAAVVGGLRAVPMRVLVCTVASLPAPVEGGIIFVRDGGGGGPCLAFSDGVSWLRTDSALAVGVTPM